MSKGEVTQVNGRRVASPEYRSWQMMKNRVLNQKAQDFAYYGGRGVVIDPAWMEFSNFLADMGRRPAARMTLERVDVNKGYCKANCVWATRKAQARNRNCTKLSEVEAAEIRSLYSCGRTQVALGRIFGVSQRTISLIVRGESWA